MITLNSLVLILCVHFWFNLHLGVNLFSSITMFKTQVWSCVNNCSFRQSEFAIEKGGKSLNVENLLKIVIFLFGGH